MHRQMEYTRIYMDTWKICTKTYKSLSYTFWRCILNACKFTPHMGNAFYRACAHIITYISTHLHTHVQYTYIHSFTYSQQLHTHPHIHIHTSTHPHPHTHINTRTCTNTHPHLHILYITECAHLRVHQSNIRSDGWHDEIDEWNKWNLHNERKKQQCVVYDVCDATHQRPHQSVLLLFRSFAICIYTCIYIYIHDSNANACVEIHMYIYIYMSHNHQHIYVWINNRVFLCLDVNEYRIHYRCVGHGMLLTLLSCHRACVHIWSQKHTNINIAEQWVINDHNTNTQTHGNGLTLRRQSLGRKSCSILYSINTSASCTWDTT